MQNVNMKVTGKILTITVDLTKSGTESKSGKSVIIATTSGIVQVPGSMAKIGVNVFLPK